MEFATVESARKAIIASLPVNMGGEGGVRIDVGDAEGMCHPFCICIGSCLFIC